MLDLRIICTARTAPTVVSQSTSPSPSTPLTNPDRPPVPPLPSSSSPSSSFSSSSPTAPKAAVVASGTHSNTTHNPDTPKNTNTTIADARVEGLNYTCPHCDRAFASHMGLVRHLRIHRTETDEPVPGAPTYSRRTRLHCPHRHCTSVNRMGLFGHMRIHESGIDRSPDTPSPPTMFSPSLTPPTAISSTTPSAHSTYTTLSPTHTLSNSEPTTTSISVADSDTTDFSCPHCPRTFTSRIGLVGHLRIHLTETGEPVPEAPTYTRRTRLHCPH
ncbi:hypothetical protein SprV_0200802900 [Sparganum proliferum]